MTPRQLIDRLSDALGISGRAKSLTIHRDWQSDTLTVTVVEEPAEIDDAQAESIIRASQDFTLTVRGPSPVQAAAPAFADHMAIMQQAAAQSVSMPANVVQAELREVEFRQSIEIQTGS